MLIIIFPIIIYFSYNVGDFLDIPTQYISKSKYMFLGIFTSSQITVFAALFMIPAYANNRLDIINFTKISIILLQSSIIIFLFSQVSASIDTIGLIYVLVSLLGLGVSILVWKKYANILVIRISKFNLKMFKKMTSMGGWVLVNQLGSLLFLSIDLLIINHYFGPKETGMYSIVLQWSVLLRSLAGMVASVLGPLILISYANEKFDDIVNYTKFSMKFLGIMIAIPIGLIMGFASPLLSLWVGVEYVELKELLWLIVGPLVINLAVLPLFSVNTAFNKVKIPALLSILFGIVNFGLAILLSVNFELKLYGIALASAIVLTVKNTIFIPIYSAYILGLKKNYFLVQLIPGFLMLLTVLFFSFTVEMMTKLNTWLEFLCYTFLVLLLSLISIWFFFLSNNDKKIISDKLLKRF
jgi:membrane protein EpsK